MSQTKMTPEQAIALVKELVERNGDEATKAAFAQIEPVVRQYHEWDEGGYFECIEC